MAIKINGNWSKGLVLGLHTLKSKFLGNDEFGKPRFDTTRTAIGELVYKLKYKNDSEAVAKIIGMIRNSIKGIDKFDYLIPIPPSNISRKNQPVLFVSRALSKEFNVPIMENALIKIKSNTEIKNVSDFEQRKNILKDVMQLKKTVKLNGKKILLIDDLYRSGATLTIATDILLNIGKAKSVSVLALTKTRSNR